MTKNLMTVGKYWLPVAAVAVMAAGLVYASVQQDMRAGANDPQIQIAEDAAAALAGGQQPAQLISSTAHTDIGTSLSPYLIVLNDQGTAVASSAYLHGQVPQIPAGALNYAKANGENRVTWQPENGVRGALVIVHYGGTQPGFAVAGRSLREVEVRESSLLWGVMAALFLSLALSLGLVIVLTAEERRRL